MTVGMTGEAGGAYEWAGGGANDGAATDGATVGAPGSEVIIAGTDCAPLEPPAGANVDTPKLWASGMIGSDVGAGPCGRIAFAIWSPAAPTSRSLVPSRSSKIVAMPSTGRFTKRKSKPRPRNGAVQIAAIVAHFGRSVLASRKVPDPVAAVVKPSCSAQRRSSCAIWPGP